MSSNLPPGCRVCDIPGNRPEDVAWEKVHNALDEATEARHMSPEEAYTLLGFAFKCWPFVQEIRDKAVFYEREQEKMENEERKEKEDGD